VCGFSDLQIRHVWEELRDIICDRECLIYIHEDVSFVLIGDSQQYLLWERQLASDVPKVVTYSVYLTLGKGDSWTFEDERAIHHGNEDTRVKESRAS